MDASTRNVATDRRPLPAARTLVLHRRRAASVALSLALLCAAGRADVVSDWNVIAFDTFKGANIGGNPQIRGLAIVHVAMSDAVNSVQNRYTRHALNTPVDPTASAPAAAVAAARAALVALAPTQTAKLDAAYAVSLGAIGDGPAKTAGVAIGQQAAAAVLAERADDATSAPDTYRPVTTPGV